MITTKKGNIKRKTREFNFQSTKKFIHLKCLYEPISDEMLG